MTLTAYGIQACGDASDNMILTYDSIPFNTITSIPPDSICVDEVIQFFGNAVSTAQDWRWGFGDGRVFSERVLDLIGFPQTGSVDVSYSATADGVQDPYPDTRSFTVVANTGTLPDLRVTQIIA